MKEKPYTKAEILFPLVFVFLTSIIIVAISIVGLTYSNESEQTIKAARCSIFAGLGDVILNGTNNWPGLTGLTLKFSYLSAQL